MGKIYNIVFVVRTSYKWTKKQNMSIKMEKSLPALF